MNNEQLGINNDELTIKIQSMSHVMLVGIQGSGKGTQARKILDKYDDYTLFEMGAELRRFAANGTPDGEYVRSFLEQ